MAGYQGAPDPESQEDNRHAANLRKIDHIVVLMLENRSFDHLLGYLSLPVDRGGRGRTEVNGLKDTEFNPLDARTGRRVHRLSSTVFPFDPPHEETSEVRVQIGLDGRQPGDPPMGGFVRECNAKLLHEGLRDEFDPGAVMGYHTGDQVPMYDLIAQHFAVCDNWFSSVPGGTWPNRMLFYAGTSNGIVTNARNVVTGYGSEYDEMPERLFVYLLDRRGVSWKIYKHDFAWMGLFRHFDKVRNGVDRVAEMRHFVEDCATGKLPAVSFIDPNWKAFGYPSYCNDDHPPEGDIAAGQQLVAQVYEALRRGRTTCSPAAC